MFELETWKDLTFAEVDGQTIQLDLYRPRTQDADSPVVIYIHGGGFFTGDKADDPDRIEGLARQGVAVASINYRLAEQALYPAQVHDVKAAVRWLRANASEYDLAAQRVGIWGASVGGYLAAMIGLTAGDAELEGSLGGNLDQSSEVQAVVSWFGLSDLIGYTRQTSLENMVLKDPVEQAVFGAEPIAAEDEIVAMASPINRVHRGAPPFLISTGDRDRLVPQSESQGLHDALVRVGVETTMCLLGGVGHEDPHFHTAANLSLTAAWLRSHLVDA